jgi:tetratricopeptide (TPR) repeat protein
VDFNLYMVTANGLIFTVLLGICHTAAYMKGRTRGSRETFPIKGIEIPRKGQRVGLAAMVFVSCLAGSILSVRGGLADVAFNRYQTWALGEPELYFFWESSGLDEEGARQSLARALDLRPCSPEYNFAQGLDSVRSIRERVLAKARDRAQALYVEASSASPGGDTVQALARDISKGLEEKAVVDEESEEFQALVSAFVDPAKRQLQEEIRAELAEEAAPSYRKAMDIAPAVPGYRMSLAMAYETLLPPGPAFEAVRPEVDKLVEESLALAPGRPANLFRAARYYARGILGEMSGMDAARERDREVLAMFKKALHAAPGRYALPTYGFLVDEAGGDPGILFEITPDAMLPQQRLLGFCLRRGMWPEALTAVENVLVLLGIDPRGSEVPRDIQPDTLEFRLCRVTTLHQMRILKRLGRVEPWRVAEERFRGLLRVQCASLLGQASRYARLGRLSEATKSCVDCLERDWNNLGAFLTLAEIRLLPGSSRGAGGKDDLFQDLLRLERANPVPAPEECVRLAAILPQLSPEVPTEHLKARLAEALKDLGCGEAEGASRILQALLLVDAKPFVYWHQRHLIHYYLGRALEMTGSTEEAVSSYEDALGLAPSHRASLERLVALGRGDLVPAPETRGTEGESESGEMAGVEEEAPTAEDPEPEIQEVPTVRERLIALSPEVPWGIDLSGKVTLLGITLEGAEGDQADSPGFTARYLWEVSEDLHPRDYYVAYRYLDADGNIIYRDWKTLFPAPDSYGENLDGGIGTVLVHWDYLPFPPDILQEVRILVRQKRKGKVVPLPLASVSGDRWLTLGLQR